jgi:hypothetical protein
MPEKRAGGIGEKEGSEESGKVSLYSRKGGFLFSERWLRKIGKLAFFDRIMHLAYQSHTIWK